MNEFYKVIKIIDDKTIVINCGEKNGIKMGDKFQILSTGEQIIDPDTNEDLGTLDTIKEIVTVINVLPKMSICKNRTNVISNNFSNFITGLTYSEIKDKTLNIEVSQISGGLSKDLTIKIGDKVRLLKNENSKNQ